MRYALVDKESNVVRLANFSDGDTPVAPDDTNLRWALYSLGQRPAAGEFQAVEQSGVAQDADGNLTTTYTLVDWTVEQKQRAYTSALEAMYDAKAQERHYDNRFTCALRAGYAGPFQAEGTAFAVWMDTCNETAYGIMAQVLAGTTPYPTVAGLLAMMPAMVWPI